MKFYVPKFLIATLQPPQSQFRSKFGGLPWGLPLKEWRRCRQCGRLMSLLAQLSHDPPALDLGGDSHVLHLFQCQECYGFESGEGNDAVMIPASKLGYGLTQLPAGEDLTGAMASGDLVGELWIDGWREKDDDLDPRLEADIFDQNKWMKLPKKLVHSIFDSPWQTKMGGLPYWTGNGPMHQPFDGYQFLFQLGTYIHFEGRAPKPDEAGAVMIVTELEQKDDMLRIANQRRIEPAKDKRKKNAPWFIEVNPAKELSFSVEITNFGTDGTAYVFIDRKVKPAKVYWLWNR